MWQLQRRNIEIRSANAMSVPSLLPFSTFNSIFCLCSNFTSTVVPLPLLLGQLQCCFYCRFSFCLDDHVSSSTAFTSDWIGAMQLLVFGQSGYLFYHFCLDNCDVSSLIYGQWQCLFYCGFHLGLDNFNVFSSVVQFRFLTIANSF